VAESASFVPADFVPPAGFTAGDFRLEPLGPEHNERDYAAWMSSVEHIRRSPGFRDGRNWPREMSVAENRADLERHARDFVDRTGFTFTVLNSSDDVIGCIYVYPAAHDGVHDAVRAVVGTGVRGRHRRCPQTRDRRLAHQRCVAVRAASLCAFADLRGRNECRSTSAETTREPIGSASSRLTTGTPR
jgi:hypothetical protein